MNQFSEYTIWIRSSKIPEFPIELMFSYDGREDEDRDLLAANPDEVVEAIAAYIHEHDRPDMLPDRFPEIMKLTNTQLIDELHLGLNLPAIFDDYMHIFRHEVGGLPPRISSPIIQRQIIPMPPIYIPLPPLQPVVSEKEEHKKKTKKKEEEERERLRA